MLQLFHVIRTQIKYKIILPYLLLMILVMLLGSGIAIVLVADSWQERFDDQMGQVARNFTQAFAQREIGNINFLGQIVLSAANPQTGAPSVPTALRDKDKPGLENALRPLYDLGRVDDRVLLDRLIVFGLDGQALVDWERSSLNPTEPTQYVGTDLSGLAFVDQILGGKTSRIPGTDVAGDKYSGLIKFRSEDGNDALHFFTVVPAYATDSATDTDELVGGVLVAARLDTLLEDLQNQSQSAITTVYNVSGGALVSTASTTSLEDLDMSQSLLNEVASLNEKVQATIQAQAAIEQDPDSPVQGNQPEADACIDIGNLSGRLIGSLERGRLPVCSVKDTQTLSEREYQFVYAPLLIRGVQSGYFSVALSRDFVISAWSSSRWAIIAITMLLALGAVFVGYGIAQQITRPLGDLVETAEAVTHGQLERRSVLTEHNELGRLSVAFNQMTEHLLGLYTVSRDLNRSIEVEQVLAVATDSARSFVPGLEALALLLGDDGWFYYTRNDTAEPLQRLHNMRLRNDDPFFRLFTDLDQNTQITVVTDESALASTGLVSVAGLQTVLVAPLVMNDQLVGTLIFGHPDADAINSAEQQSLGVIANMSVTVLYNAMLYSRVQKDAKERQAILASIGDGVIVCDDHQRIVMLNRVAEEMLNLKNWRHVHHTLADLPLRPIEAARDMFGAQPHGEYYQVNGLVVSRVDSPVVSEEGRPVGEVVILHDVTAAVAVDQAKTDFISTISHELRSPLTVIIGFTELLLRGTGDSKLSLDQTELLAQIKVRAGDMTDMVNNAILIADIESGKLSTDIQPQDVELIVSMALAPLRPAFKQKGLTTEIDIPDDLPPVMADREQLKRALGQLLDNARRYTEHGGVTVRARSEDDAVRIDFIDTGLGIGSDILPRLFQRFQRIEGNSSKERGSGLGLAITKQLIERQGGHIEVSSTLGQGSTFSVVLIQNNEHTLAIAQPNETRSTS